MSNYDDLFNNDRYKDKRNENKPFDKAAWAEKRKQERADAYGLIDKATEEISKDPSKFKEYLDTQSRFSRYSVSNALLIAFQHPGATRVADFETWKESNAFINKGAKAIIMLEPGSEYTREDGSTGVNLHVKRVFDISQTDAADTADKRTVPDERSAIKALIASSPCEIVLVEEMPGSANARYDNEKDTIFIVRGLEGDDIFRSLSFEICVAKNAAMGIERQDSLFPSYCSAYMLCERNSFDTKTFNFEKAPEKLANMDSQTIRRTLNSIRDMVNDVSQDMSRQFEGQEKNKRSKDNGAR